MSQDRRQPNRVTRLAGTTTRRNDPADRRRRRRVPQPHRARVWLRGFIVTAVGWWRRRARGAAAAFAVVDLRLGDGNGLELVGPLRQARPDIRIVVLTGYGNIATAVAAVKEGAVDYLAKPADADAIEQALTAHGRKLPPPPSNPMSADRVRWEHIQRVFEQCDRNVSETARRSTCRRTLQRILQARARASPGTAALIAFQLVRTRWRWAWPMRWWRSAVLALNAAGAVNFAHGDPGAGRGVAVLLAAGSPAGPAAAAGRWRSGAGGWRRTATLPLARAPRRRSSPIALAA